MTLAIGVSPGDGSGAVLVTDSLVQHRLVTGVRALLCLTPRFEPLPGAQGAAIVSAMARGDWAPCSSAVGIEAAAAELIGGLAANLASTPWQFADGHEVVARGEVVAAGVDDAGRVRLVQWRTWSAPTWAEGPTAFVGGAAADLDVRPGSPPAMLAACAVYGFELARMVLAEDRRRSGHATLDAALARGVVPAMAPPLWLAVVTAAGVNVERRA